MNSLVRQEVGALGKNAVAVRVSAPERRLRPLCDSVVVRDTLDEWIVLECAGVVRDTQAGAARVRSIYWRFQLLLSAIIVNNLLISFFILIVREVLMSRLSQNLRERLFIILFSIGLKVLRIFPVLIQVWTLGFHASVLP